MWVWVWELLASVWLLVEFGVLWARDQNEVRAMLREQIELGLAKIQFSRGVNL